MAITDKSSQETFEDLMVPSKNLIGLAVNFATGVPGIIQASTFTPNPKPVTRPLGCWERPAGSSYGIKDYNPYIIGFGVGNKGIQIPV